MPFTLDGNWIPHPKVYGPLKVYTEKRKGSYVTIIKNLPLEQKELTQFTSELKKHLGVGGTIKEGDVEFQGDKKEAILIYLEKKGFKKTSNK